MQQHPGAVALIMFTMDTSDADIYARMSVDGTGQHLGVDRQVKETTGHLEKLGFKVRRVFVDNNTSAMSGAARPEFERLLETPESQRKPIGVWHMDRLARRSADLERVLGYGQPVYAVTAGFFDLSTPSGRATARTVVAWATFECEQRALRQVAAARQLAESGKPCWVRRPFGLEMDGSINFEEAVVLREAANRVLKGESMGAICRWLNATGVKTSIGNEWTNTPLRKILTSPRTAGLREYHGEIVGPGTWAAVIGRGTWNDLRRVLLDPRRGNYTGGRVVRHLLSGIITAPCGTGMTSAGMRPAPKGAFMAYDCRGDMCTHAPMEICDCFVTELAILRLSEASAHDVWASGGDDLAAARIEHAELSERLTNLGEDYADGTITRAAMRSGSERIKARLAELDGRIGAAIGADAAAIIGHGDEAKVRTAWAEAPLAARRTVIGNLFDDIKVLGRGRGYRLPFDPEIHVDWSFKEKPTETA